MDMNKVFIIGRLTRDAELKYTVNGMPVSKFALAVNEKKREGDNWVDEVNYIDITLWGKQAESLSQYLAKGKQIAVDGKLKQERWTDRDTGNNRSKLGVVAFSIQLLGSGNHNGGESQSGYNHTSSANTDGYGGGYSRTSPTSASLRAAHAQNPPSDDGFVDDIPF